MSKLEQKKKQKREALLLAAFSLFTSKGINETSIADIVSEANMAKGTFYLYFKDKYDIRNKLVSHKTGELFFQAHEALQKTGLHDFEEQVHFLIDYILDILDQDHALLTFIAKNLAWGVFKGAFEEKQPDEDYHFYESYLNLLSKSKVKYQNPELMLFTIIELVGSTCHSCILYQQPVSLAEYKPYLHRSIDGILLSFRDNQTET